MSNPEATLDMSEVGTEDLEAAVMGASDAPLSDTNPDPDTQPDPTPGPKPQDDPPPIPDPNPAPTPDPAPSDPAPNPKPEPAPAPSNLDPVEIRTREILSRNPDIKIEQAQERAREELGISAEHADPEPTVAERIEAIEEQLKAAGANEGLFTAEIAELMQEHSRLCASLAAQQAVAEARQSDAAEAYTKELSAAREESYNIAKEMYPDALDPEHPLAKELSKVIAEAEEAKNPLLHDPQAPELFLAMANARLPEAQRVEPKRQAATHEKPTSGQSAPTGHAPSPANVLPVSAGRSTAQPAPATIDPAHVDRAIKDTPTKDLEAALFGEGSGAPVLLRL